MAEAAEAARNASRLSSQDVLQQQWGGPMFQRDRRGLKASPMLTSLLKGIAAAISSKYEKGGHQDLTPPSMAAFYRACGGDYNPLFLQMPPQSIAFIYTTLECPHSLQPSTAPRFSPPQVPALKLAGFARWQTIQLLLGPEEHVPFIQNALRMFDIQDVDTGKPFPKEIPASVFPSAPDPGMVAWHNSISNRLRRDCEPSGGRSDPPARSRGSSGDAMPQGIARADERADAAHFFANPLYRTKEGRPAVVRQSSTASPGILQSGKALVETIYNGGKMILSPNTFGGPPTRQKSHSSSPGPSRDRSHSSSHGGKHGGDDHGFDFRAGTSPRSRPLPRQSSHKSITTPSPLEMDREASRDKVDVGRQYPTRRRRSHDSRAEPEVRLGSHDAIRRHRSMDYREISASPGQVPVRRQHALSSPLTNSTTFSSGGSTPIADGPRGAHGPAINLSGASRSQQQQQQQQHSPQQPRHLRVNVPDYFGSTTPQGHGRPAMAARADSDGTRRASISGFATPRWDGTNPKQSSNRLDIPSASKLTPTSRTEWDEVRQRVRAPGTGGAGVKFEATTIAHGDGVGEVARGDEALSGNDLSLDNESERERRLSIAKNGPSMNGVKGRRYPNEAPWD